MLRHFSKGLCSFPLRNLQLIGQGCFSWTPPKLARTVVSQPAFRRVFSTSPAFPQKEQLTTEGDDSTGERDTDLIHSRYYNHTDTGGLSATEYLNSLNEEDTKKLKVIKLEYEVSLASGEHVPEVMTDEDWLRAWDCSGRAQRKKTYKFLAKTENIARKKDRLREANKVKEDKRQHEKQSRAEDGSFVYNGFSKNTILLRITDKTMNHYQAKKCYDSLMFGEKIVFDMSYDDLMRPFDVTNTVDQILEGYGLNKRYPEPFYINFCNAKPDGRFVKRLDFSTGGGYKDYPINVTEKSYLDLFPKEDLVYLTPNAPDYLKEYDPYKTYIIGGLVDKVVTKPVTMAKAKREGIKMAKLPIDLHMRFIMGNKSLCLNQILGIMCELKQTGDWRKAFKYIPRRKAVFHDEVEEFERRSAKQAVRQQRRMARSMDYD